MQENSTPDVYDMFYVRGKERFRKNGLMIRSDVIPEEEKEKLREEKKRKENAINQPRPDEPPKDEKACIFCGAHSRFTRFVNLRTVYVCDSDYYDKTVGKIAQKLKELSV